MNWFRFTCNEVPVPGWSKGARDMAEVKELDSQVKHMVERFLQWKLPENFSPDGGISFKKMFNEHTSHPMKHEPVGTNLFDATQAEAMVRYMLEGVASHAPATAGPDYPAILERERTVVAEGITNIKKAISGREWLTEGRGSYEWNDDRWHGEFKAAIDEILKAMKPLEKIAEDLKYCPQKWDEVQKARAVPIESDGPLFRADSPAPSAPLGTCDLWSSTLHAKNSHKAAACVNWKEAAPATGKELTEVRCGKCNAIIPGGIDLGHECVSSATQGARGEEIVSDSAHAR